MQSFLCVTVTPLSPQISCFRSLHHLSSNNSENTNHRYLPLTGNNHCNSRLSENIHFYRNNHSFQNRSFQFSISILDGLCISFNSHHFFMRKQFMCVDCYTGRLTFSNIILHKRPMDEYWLPIKLKQGRKNVCQKF